jgi:hypothetical protein
LKIFVGIFWSALFATAAVAQAPAAMPSLRAPHDFALTTDPSSSFWREARPVYAQVDRSGNVVPQLKTQVRSRWTADSIYFLFVCPYKDLYLKPSPDLEHETYELWNWNVAEVFIGTDFKDIKRYKEFEISPKNEWIDLDIDLHDPHHENGWKWNSGFEHAARIDAASHVWYTALRIPFTALGTTPHPGQTFRLNLYRTDGGPPNEKEVMWQPVMGKTFHAPEHFGLLNLTEK